jgi:hypothetical protein
MHYLGNGSCLGNISHGESAPLELVNSLYENGSQPSSATAAMRPTRCGIQLVRKAAIVRPSIALVATGAKLSP